MEDDKAVPHWMQRTSILFGPEKIKKLMNANILLVGLGGVGGVVAEMLVRAGIGSITLVDNDIVDDTNRNRQIPALYSTVGAPKTLSLSNRLKEINPDLKMTLIQEFVKDGKAFQIISAQKYDYAIDCIDTLSSKCWFIRHCVENNLRVVTALGAGGKSDPFKIVSADISESQTCHLARQVRKRLAKWNIRTGIPVVYSTEEVDGSRLIPTPNELKKNIIGTVSYMPAAFGCALASIVIRDLMNDQPTIQCENISKRKLKKIERQKMKEKKRKEYEQKKTDAKQELVKDNPTHGKLNKTQTIYPPKHNTGTDQQKHSQNNSGGSMVSIFMEILTNYWILIVPLLYIIYRWRKRMSY